MDGNASDLELLLNNFSGPFRWQLTEKVNQQHWKRSRLPKFIPLNRNRSSQVKGLIVVIFISVNLRRIELNICSSQQSDHFLHFHKVLFRQFTGTSLSLQQDRIWKKTKIYSLQHRLPQFRTPQFRTRQRIIQGKQGTSVKRVLTMQREGKLIQHGCEKMP